MGASLALLIKYSGLHSRAAHQHSMAARSEPCHHVLRDFDEAGRIGPKSISTYARFVILPSHTSQSHRELGTRLEVLQGPSLYAWQVRARSDPHGARYSELMGPSNS